MKLYLPIAAGLLAAGACCCGGLVDSLEQKAGKGLGGVTVGGSMPDAFGGFSTYEGANLQAGADVAGVASATFEVTGATPRQVVDHYKKEAEGMGWSVQTSVNVEDTSTFQATKEGKTLTVTATMQDGKVWLVLSMQQ